MTHHAMHYDPEPFDVLYVKLPGERIYTSKTLHDDTFVVLNMNTDRAVVGLQVIGAKEIGLERWRKYYHTDEIPEQLFAYVDDFLSGRVEL